MTAASLITLLDTRMTRPVSYGWFHLMFAAIIAALSVLLWMKGRRCSKKAERRVVFAAWAVMAVLEIYKQVNFTFSVNGETVEAHYQWYAFPFQMCSMPLYILPWIAFFPKGRVRDGCISFMAFFSLFAGLCTYVYPEQVFISTVGINIQTMVHHGLQIAMGVFLISCERDKLSLRFFKKGFFVFLVTVAAAALLNEVFCPLCVPEGETFNMFYISSRFESTLPVLSLLNGKVPSLVQAAAYVVCYTLCALLMYLLALIMTRKSRAKKTGGPD